MQKSLVLFFLLFTFGLLWGQQSNLYIPLNIQKAIDKGTRTNLGIPGKNYWQNSSDYKITAEIIADSGYLVGEEIITYHNNSPDSLKNLIIRLYQDIAKPGAVRDWYIGNNLEDGVILKYLIVDNDSINIAKNSREIWRSSTNLTVRLKNKILPKTSVKIEIGWEFEIPKKIKVRMGNYGNGNLYIAYWYPQIAVYDDIDGWDRVDYSGTVEFYNDFSNYDVSVKAPKGMVVWATGELQNGKEVLREDIFNKYEKAKISDETINIITPEDYKSGHVTADNEINIWKFLASNVCDFTIATATNYNWDGASVVVDKKTGRRSLTDAMYKDSTVHYDKTAQYARETIKYLSEEIPGYPYPYSHASSYCNGRRGGGMESPMISNDGAPLDRANHVGLIFHEISHNYFPFIMGTNERKYAWMDEGWATFLPTDIIFKYNPEYDYRKNKVRSYSIQAGTEYDLPLVTPSYSYKTKSARLGFYDKPANAYFELKELLGDDIFKKAMLTYINRWNGKHPLPIDFFYTFNEVAGEDLSWFWNPWFYEYGYPDLALDGIEKNADGLFVTIKKVGKIPTRINLEIEYIDSSVETISKSVKVWKDGKDKVLVSLKSGKKVKKIVLGHKYIADVNKNNNFFEM